MRCPICGAKLKDEKCPYCLITNKQVIYASNKKAKAFKKENKEKDNVHTSTIRPKDVNKVKIWLFTVLGGWFGADSFLIPTMIMITILLLVYKKWGNAHE